MILLVVPAQYPYSRNRRDSAGNQHLNQRHNQPFTDARRLVWGRGGRALTSRGDAEERGAAPYRTAPVTGSA